MDRLNLSSGKFSDKNAIMVNGVLVDIGVAVFRWDNPKGFDGYTTERVVVENRKTGRDKVISGPRYSKRKGGIDSISQFFIHHSGGDGKDPSTMYRTLYYDRDLSVHFAAEDDGRIFQFNDVIDCCWHGGTHNQISFGVESCLFPLVNKKPNYYSAARRKRTGNLPHKTMVDVIHGAKIKVFCFTEPQLDALARMGAGVWVALGQMRTGNDEKNDVFFEHPPMFYRDHDCNIPRTVIPRAKRHVGMIGHLQTKRAKIDPAGFPWERFENLVEDYFNKFTRALKRRSK